MKKFTVATLRTKQTKVPKPDGTETVFESARLDKLFKDIHPDLCVDVAVFNNTFNITCWIAKSGVYFRTKYSREYDNNLGMILYATHKLMHTMFRANMFDEIIASVPESLPVEEGEALLDE